jgi:hypothetical protein
LTNRPLEKLIPYLDLVKGTRLDGALGSLKGARLLGAFCVHVDVGTPQWTVGR